MTFSCCISGKYVKNCRVSREGVHARDPQVARQLWDISVFMTGCFTSDLPILPRNYQHITDCKEDSWDEMNKPPPTARIATLEPDIIYQIART